MAGAGYKLFATGDVLTAAQVNTYLMQQSVMVFASATARNTALSGVLSEGMVAYLLDTNDVTIYDGAAWNSFGSGDITGVTAGTGLTGGGTSGSVTLTLDATVPVGYTTTATAAGTTTLTAASTHMQFFTGVTTQTIVLPVTSTLVLGEAFIFHNNSTGALTVQSSGGNTVVTIPAGNTYMVTCILTSGTTAASWDADFTGTSTTTGSGSTTLATSPTITTPIMVSPEERSTVSATAATGTVNFDLSTQGLLYYTTNASANFTLNFRGNSGTTLTSMLAVGDAISAVFLVTNGSTAYYPTVYQIDGSAVTPKWSGGTAPAAGNASSIDAYSFTIIKTAATPTYTVLAGGATKFA
jgi:hypothetical protein